MAQRLPGNRGGLFGKSPALSYIPPPKNLPGFPKADKVRGKTGMAGGKGKKRKIRRRWIDPDTGDILEWDYQHGKIEKFNPNGKHLGEFDPETGKQTKPAKPGRTITPTMAAPKGKMEIVYYVRWYQKSGDAYIGEALLAGVDEQQVRRVFKLEPDEPPGDCLPIETDDETEWLETKAPEVRVLSDQYQYFVEASQP